MEKHYELREDASLFDAIRVIAGHDCVLVREPGKISDVSDLSFGEYVRLLENENRWHKLQLKVDRVKFIEQLSRIRDIRNDVMHFDPDGVTDDALDDLRRFSRFLDRIQMLIH